MCEVTFDQMAGCQGRHERQLPGQYGGADDSRQLRRVVARVGLTRAMHTQHLSGQRNCTWQVGNKYGR